MPWKVAVSIWQQAEWVTIAQNCLKEASEGGGRREQGAERKEQRHTDTLKMRPRMSCHGSYVGNNTHWSFLACTCLSSFSTCDFSITNVSQLGLTMEKL